MLTDALVAVGLAGILAGVGAGALAFGRRRAGARAGANSGRRVRWVGAGLLGGAALATAAAASHLVAGRPADPLVPAGSAAAVLVAASLGANQWPPLGRRIDRVIPFAATTLAAAVAAALAATVAVGFVGQRPRGPEREAALGAYLGVALAISSWPTIRDKMAATVNRLAFGAAAAPEEALRTFGARLTRALPLDELLLQLAESLRRCLPLASAEVWTGADGHLERTVALPRRPADAVHLGTAELLVVSRAGTTGGTWLDVWLPGVLDGRDPAFVRVAPMTHAGELLGLLLVERRADAEPASTDDDRVLVDLARQVGLALHNARLDSALRDTLDDLNRANAELRASRARVVASADAARRRLERDLHDGAQQHLVALSVKLRLARDAQEADPEAASALFDELSVEVKAAVAELRSLAHGIYPPLLTSDGLGGALRAAGGRATLPTRVLIETEGRYDPAVEAAVYFCVLEALQNAAKHAGAGASATVTLSGEVDPRRLLFTVTDDGAGFDTAGGGGSGQGFLNMADRLGAIDGTLEVRSTPGKGTTVAGAIPLRAETPEGTADDPGLL